MPNNLTFFAELIIKIIDHNYIFIIFKLYFHVWQIVFGKWETKTMVFSTLTMYTLGTVIADIFSGKYQRPYTRRHIIISIRMSKANAILHTFHFHYE